MSSTPTNFLRYASKSDISVAIDVLKTCRDKFKDKPEFEYAYKKISPSLNRVILELEELK